MYLLHKSRASRRAIVRRRIVLVAAVLLLLGACRYAFPELRYRYLLGKQRRALEQAASFLASNDSDRAAAALEVALTCVPENIAAWREAAALLEQAGIPEAITVRQRIAAMQPGRAEPLIDLATTALALGDFSEAADTLAQLQPDQRNTPQSRRLLFQIALGIRHQPAVVKLGRGFAEDQCDPSLRSSLLILADFYTQGSGGPAQKRLEAAAAVPQTALVATRELWLDAILRGDGAAAQKWAANLDRAPGRQFADRLAVANTALLFSSAPFEPTVQPLLTEAADPSNMRAFVLWAHSTGHADFIRIWIAQLPPPLANRPDMLNLRLTLAVEAGDMSAVAAILNGPPGEDRRRAAFGRALAAFNAASTGQSADAVLGVRRLRWRAAIDAAADDLPSLRLLLQLASRWKWDRESFEVVCTISDRFPRATWAHQARADWAHDHHDTVALATALDSWRRASPLSQRLRYDCALIGVLRAHGSPSPQDVATLLSLHESDRANPYFATGAAYVRALQGQVADAVTIVEGMSESQRSEPSRAPYLAYIYQRNHAPATARHYKAICRPADLLPEEQAILDSLSDRPATLTPAR